MIGGRSVEAEKLAALGGLVAGVAHEVNTPLGVSVTTVSVIKDSVDELGSKYSDKTLTSEDFEQIIETLAEASIVLSQNLDRAARLIRDFKRTAVDQVSEARQEFNVSEVLRSLLASLHHETSKVGVVPFVRCANDISMNSLPGVLTQVITNLILNSLRHAFPSVREPRIEINVEDRGDVILINYSDNGVGVPSELHDRIFEPFFTTKRCSGGSGLGLNIVYNLVSRKLQGTISIRSESDEGITFVLQIAKVIPPSDFGI